MWMNNRDPRALTNEQRVGRSSFVWCLSLKRKASSEKLSYGFRERLAVAEVVAFDGSKPPTVAPDSPAATLTCPQSTHRFPE